MVVSAVLRLLTPPRAGAIRIRIARAARRAPFWLAIFALCWFYKFIVDAGNDTPTVYGIYHDQLADGFLSGQLSIPLAPDPRLLKVKDPYDYAHVNLWSLDASYYKGKYYIYWGPVPALFMAAFKAVFNLRRTLGDHYLALFFHCLALGAGALVVERLLLHLFASRSRFLLVLGVAAFAFANPTPHAVATASTYHTAIIAAQAWLVAGFLFAFDGVWHAGTTAARWWRLPITGTLWALALGSRVTTLPAIALLVALTAAGSAWPEPRRLRAIIVNAWLVGLPLAFMGGALLLYNKLRFDDWLEFGSNIQLSGFPRFRSTCCRTCTRTSFVAGRRTARSPTCSKSGTRASPPSRRASSCPTTTRPSSRSWAGRCRYRSPGSSRSASCWRPGPGRSPGSATERSCSVSSASACSRR
jgi:hypothetical protein